PAITQRYYNAYGDTVFEKDGWFDTGDVATMDRYGYMQITDRAKDVIKSGGEWISSIDLENLAVGHPKVAEAAVSRVSHPKWDERPLLVIVLKKGETATKEEILGFMQGKTAKWWIPDDVVFVEEIPHTATGKIQKLMLRQQFKDYRLPTAQAAEQARSNPYNLNLFFKAPEATTRLEVENPVGGRQRMTLRSAYSPTLNGGPTVLLWGDAAGVGGASDFLSTIHAT